MKRKVYKMRKISSVLLLLLAVFGLCSCGDDDGIPEGMKLGCDPSDTGYYFYVPEEWTVSSYADISMAHVSSLDNSSVSIAKMDADKLPAEALNAEWDIAKAIIAEYAIADTKKLPHNTDIEFVMTEGKNYEECIFAEKPAVKITYTFSLKDTKTEKTIKFRTMQILVRNGEQVYIFTYQSRDEIMREETTYYDYYYTFVKPVIDNFKFAEGEAKERENPADTDGDGYYLASDASLSGFELYLPNSYKLTHSSGFVSAMIEDGANLSVTRATSTGVSIVNYAKTRRDELSGIYSDFTDISVSVKQATSDGIKTLKDTFTELSEENIKVDGSLKFGNSESNMFAYEYSFASGDAVYRVYQIYGISGRSGYVLTYTARADVYEAHLSEISDVLERIVFE